MLAPTAERIEDALQRLSADDCALLELSLRRGISDDDIATLLRVHPEHVEHRREIAMDRLAENLDADRSEVASMVGQSGRANTGAAVLEAPPPLGRRASELPPSEDPARRARRRRNLIGLAALAAAAAALAIALSSGGDEPAPPADQPPPAPAPPAAGQRVGLTPLVPGGSARGSARLQGSRLELKLSGLPASSYSVWLFDDVSSARMVARFQGAQASLALRLPKGFQSHRFIDVSREPADGNANHSGESVLRAPLARLLRR